VTEGKLVAPGRRLTIAAAAVAAAGFAAVWIGGQPSALANPGVPPTTVTINPTPDGGIFTNNANTYATQGVVDSGGAITIASGIGYSMQAAQCTNPAPPNSSFIIRFTLPPGVVFAQTANANAAAGFTPVGVLPPTLGGHAGDNFAEYDVGVQSGTTVPGTISLLSFTITGATALQNATIQSGVLNSAGFNITETISASTNTDPTTCVPANETATVALAFSGSQVIFATSPTPYSSPPVIDVNASSLGTMFQQPLGTLPDTLVADLGAYVIGSNGFWDPTLSSAYQLNFLAGEPTLALTGAFGGLAATFLNADAFPAPAPGTCSPTPAGAYPGVFSGDGNNQEIDTFSNVGTGAGNPFAAAGPAPAFAFLEACWYATGTKLLSANQLNQVTAPVALSPIPGGAQQGFGATLTIAGVNYSPALQGNGLTFPLSSSGPISGYNYNGLVTQVSYANNLTGVYSTYTRIVNNSSQPVPVYALVQGDGDSTATTTVEALPGLAANSNDTVSDADIVTAAGIAPGPFGRVSIIYFAPGGPACVGSSGTTGATPCPVTITHLMYEPSGDVVNMQ
jgi:hypothetical protein